MESPGAHSIRHGEIIPDRVQRRRVFAISLHPDGKSAGLYRDARWSPRREIWPPLVNLQRQFQHENRATGQIDGSG